MTRPISSTRSWTANAGRPGGWKFYPSGMCFAYGGDMGQDEVLDPTPFPEDLRTLNRPGEVEVRAIPRQLFIEVWNQAQERPDGFMGMFF